MIHPRDVFAAEIQYFRLEPKYWREILRRFKDTGLTCVSTYVPWECHTVRPPDEDHPVGQFDFQGASDPRLNLRGFLDLVEKHELSLNFRPGPFCCAELPHGGLPAWLVCAEPDLMVWDWQNRPAQGYWIHRREGSQPSYMHPDYLALVHRWFDAVDAVAIEHLQAHGGCISMINLDNEVSFLVQDSFLGADYNPVNVRPGGLYHEFLQEKYTSARNLPYEGRFDCFEDVHPPRHIPAEIAGNLAWYLDWAEFKQWLMCDYLHALREMHEENGVGEAVFMTNLNPHRPEGVPAGMPAFEKATGGIVGYDFYRQPWLSYSGYHSMARVCKLMTASLEFAFSAEFMGGTWDAEPKARVSADHMRFMARCALAHGCKALSWFMFHDRDTWGDAPVSAHGHPRPSLEVLGEVVETCFQKVGDWASLQPVGDVGIVYELTSASHTHLGDPMPCADNDLHVGGPVIDGVRAGQASAEYEGLFRVVEQAGCQAGVIDVAHDPGGLGAYKLVLLPGSPVLASAASSALAEYVRAGGTLVVTGAWPGRDETGEPMKFLGIARPRPAKGQAQAALGRGRVIWRPEYIAQEPPEAERLDAPAMLAEWLAEAGVTPAVLCQPLDPPVRWQNWRPGGGIGEHVQPRCLGAAVLQVGQKDKLLFVLNLYPVAAEFELTFADTGIKKLTCLDTGQSVTVTKRKATVDVDRKHANIYKVGPA